MAGTLTVCATPIGNLGDLSPRALEALKAADLIAAEDTRHTRGLLTHFDIHVPMLSCHKDNESDRSEEIIQRLEEGANIVLVSDAGTPAVSDPGEILVRKCRERGIPVTAIPGPCAFVTALSMSGMPSRRFVFEGFLPSASRERKERIGLLAAETRTVLLYEAPHRLKKTLQELLEAWGNRDIAIARELTKIHEELVLTTLAEAVTRYGETEPRGEYVLIVGGADPARMAEEKRAGYESLTLTEHMALYPELPPKEAMKRVAADRGLSRRDVYEGLLKEKENG